MVNDFAVEPCSANKRLLATGRRRGSRDSLRGSETRPRVLGLILGHESISAQTHAFVRSFINRTAVKISITKSNVGLAFL